MGRASLSQEEHRQSDDRHLDAILGAVLTAAQAARGQQAANAPPSAEARQRARQEYLRRMRRRGVGGGGVASHRRWFALTVGVLVCLATLSIGALAYLIHDYPEVLTLRAYLVPVQVEGTLLARTPQSDRWIMLSGESALGVGTVIAAPAWGSVRLGLEEIGLEVTLEPGARMRCQKGWQSPLVLISGRAEVSLQETAKDPAGLVTGRSIDLLADGFHSSSTIARLRLEAPGARVRVMVDDLYAGASAQLVLVKGRATLRTGRRVPTRATPLQTGKGFLLCGGQLAEISLPTGDQSGANAAVVAWPGSHWLSRTGAGSWKSSSTDPTGDPHSNAADAIVELVAIAKGESPQGASLMPRRAAALSLGLLDDYESVSALLVLIELQPELEDACIDALGRFQDPRSRLAFSRALDELGSAPGRASVAALALSRYPHGLRGRVADLEKLLAQPALEGRERVATLIALALARTDELYEPVDEIRALVGLARQADLGSSREVDTALAALAGLEELAIRGSRSALTALVDLEGKLAPALGASLETAIFLAREAH